MQKTGHHWLDQKEPEPPYIHQEYPKTMHHEKKPPVLVTNPAEEAKLGPDWYETPAVFKDGEEGEAAKRAADGKRIWDKQQADNAAKAQQSAAKK
jgi:hypothetical protein